MTAKAEPEGYGRTLREGRAYAPTTDVVQIDQNCCKISNWFIGSNPEHSLQDGKEYIYL